MSQFPQRTGGIADASPVFLSDELIALLVSPGHPGGEDSRIVVFKWLGSKLELSAVTTKEFDDDRIFAVSGDRILLAGYNHQYLYSSDLKKRSEIPIGFPANFFPRSSTIGTGSQKGWKAFHVGPKLTLISSGSGNLQSLSDDAVLFVANDFVHIVTLDGRPIGLIPAPRGATDSHEAETAGSGRLYLGFQGEQRIVDFHGKQLTRIHPPQGWGFRHGWSADGGRLLFDHFIRRLTVWATVQDVFGRLLGAPINDTGETIAVMDARSGASCFAFESPLKLLGSNSYHADLSPSGKWVVISTSETVSVYQLPEVCE